MNVIVVELKLLYVVWQFFRHEGELAIVAESRSLYLQKKGECITLSLC